MIILTNFFVHNCFYIYNGLNKYFAKSFTFLGIECLLLKRQLTNCNFLIKVAFEAN